MADEASFEVNGRRYNLPSDLTMGEMCDAELHFGVDFSVKKPSIRLSAALIYTAIRREDSTVTVEDIRALPAEVFQSVMEAGDARPPDEESSDDGASSSASSKRTSDDSETDHNGSGARGSATGSGSPLATSRT